jgi:hypothetical protein
MLWNDAGMSILAIPVLHRLAMGFMSPDGNICYDNLLCRTIFKTC